MTHMQFWAELLSFAAYSGAGFALGYTLGRLQSRIERRRRPYSVTRAVRTTKRNGAALFVVAAVLAAPAARAQRSDTLIVRTVHDSIATQRADTVVTPRTVWVVRTRVDTIRGPLAAPAGECWQVPRTLIPPQIPSGCLDTTMAKAFGGLLVSVHAFNAGAGATLVTGSPSPFVAPPIVHDTVTRVVHDTVTVLPPAIPPGTTPPPVSVVEPALPRVYLDTRMSSTPSTSGVTIYFDSAGVMRCKAATPATTATLCAARGIPYP
jgi:hypothetical protein